MELSKALTGVGCGEGAVADPGIAGGGILSRASMEGPKVPSEARRREALRGVGSGEGRRSPSPVWGSGSYAPRKFLKNQP